MPSPAIEVSGLSKRYIIGHHTKTDTLRDALTQGVGGMWSAMRRRRAAKQVSNEEFWALREVSFSVDFGEVVGIIGHNGAGKSTLLKVISRITEPTEGRVALNGRVASLLEVGTGFHPELSGRENIYLNGAILGMSRAEIRKKFDEIVAFSEVERFLDTPVKRYSSGMYVRLAFAVAAHLEPEILIVDEVLAVGDAQFQEKCLGKIRDVAGSGRAVLFVSHNLAATQALCSRALLMRAGRIIFDSTPAKTVSAYLNRATASPTADDFFGVDPALAIDRAAFVQNKLPVIKIELRVRSSQRRRLAVEFILFTTSGAPAAMADSGTLDPTLRLDFEAGETRLTWAIDVSMLANGSYKLRTQLVDPFAHIVIRHDAAGLVEVARAPTPPRLRALELDWQAGLVELPLRRTDQSGPT